MDDKHTDHNDADGSSMGDLNEPGHVFDQTNGLAGDVSGDSDGTAASDTDSEANRDRPDSLLG